MLNNFYLKYFCESLTFFILMAFMSPVYSAVPLEISVKLGFGRVNVEVVSPTEFKENQSIKTFIENLELALLTNESLAPIVTGSLAKNYQLIGGYRDTTESSESDAAHIQEWVQVILAKAKGDLPNEGALSGVISEGKRRVVMGSHLVVTEEEHLDEVVVIAGSADIRGSVDKLVMIGGNVRLHSTAVIKNELNTLGGHLVADPGSVVSGKSVSVGMPLSDESWLLLFKKIKDSDIGQFLRSDLTQFFIFLLKIIALMAFAVLGHYVTPMYQQKVEKRLKENMGQSFIWGFISLFLVVPSIMILALSVIGLPLMPLQFTLYFLFFIFGYIHSANLLAVKILSLLKGFKIKNFYLSLLFGLVCLELLSWLPYAGGVLKWTLIFMGFGAASKVFYSHLLSPPSVKLQQLKSIS